MLHMLGNCRRRTEPSADSRANPLRDLFRRARAPIPFLRLELYRAAPSSVVGTSDNDGDARRVRTFDNTAKQTGIVGLGEHRTHARHRARRLDQLGRVDAL